MEQFLVSILTLILGIFAGVGITFLIGFIKGTSIRKKADKFLEEAKKEAEKQKRDRLLEFKEESYKLKQEVDREIKEKKEELKSNENRLLQRENSLDKRDEILQKRELSLDEKEKDLLANQKELQKKDEKMEELLKNEMETLESISKFSRERARELIMKRCEEEMTREVADYVKQREQEAKLQANEVARATEQTVSTITLPNDDMKGRLIGREGRNIRTIEAVTGVDLIIDDTPETIVVSSFDPLRREIAKITIETLIKDGRIHPSRIEEVYDKVCKDMNNKITELGSNACYELGITKVDPELVNLVGKLYFRTSYGQNALKHSKEVGELCGLMAAELGQNVPLAKRAGLLHWKSY